MRLGIDLGGTKIEIIALDGAGRELLRRRVATPQGNYYETLQAIAQLVRDTEAELGPQCYCGKQGCIETFLSGPGMAKLYQRESKESVRPELVEGMDSLLLSSEEIVKRAEQGDAAYEHRLARGLAHVINILDPDVIVLGGGMSNIERLYANVPKLWGSWVFSDRVDTKLVKNLYGDSSGARGAAWL